MTSYEPPEIPRDQPRAPETPPIEPPASAPAPSPVGYPADLIESPFDPQPSNTGPIIAGIVTAVIMLAALAVFIYTNRSEPVAAAPSTSSPPITTTLAPTSTSGDPAVPVAARDYEFRFESGRCEFSLVTDAEFECGWLVVPEDRQQADNGRQVRIHVARFESTNPDPPADPIIYLDGGPGGSTLEPLEFSFNQVWQPLLEDRDLIFFDQRGVGFSTPSLDCPGERQWAFSTLDQDLTAEQERSGQLTAIQTCRDRLVADGVDLSQYTSAENAADVADLRLALELEEVNLLGISYGTRLAATVMRDFPEGVRSVVLDSTYTPDVDLTSEGPANLNRALAELWEGCEQDLDCAERYPNLEERFYALVEAFEAQPTRAPVRDFLNGGSWDVLFDGDWLLGTVFQGLYSDQVIPLLPQMIEELESRETGTLTLLTSNTLAQAEFLSLGMMLSVQCHEEVPFTSAQAIADGLEGYDRIADAFDGASNLGDFMLEVCEIWDSGMAAAVENEPVVSEIPTLVLAGEYDPNTPPRWGAAAADGLPNSVFVEFPGLGHGTSIADDCPLSITFAFLNAPTEALDAGCVDSMAPIDFKIPGEAVAAITLVPFSEDILGTTVSGVVPEGWQSVGFGAYARGESAVDQTAILQQVAPLMSPDSLIGLLADQFGMVAEPEQTSTQESSMGTWRLFRGDAEGFSVDIAATDLGNAAAVIVVISDPTEREVLLGELLLPAIDAFRAQT